MKHNFSIFCTILILHAVPASYYSPIHARQNSQPSAEETEKNLKVLQAISFDGNPTDTQLHEASEAIRSLTQFGTEAAVPELAKLLEVTPLNTAVRTALINMPNGTGIAALRESLDTLRGENLVGVMESLGSARDEKSVEKLLKLVDHNEKAVADSAMRALGKIAVSEAVSAVQNGMDSGDMEKKHAAAQAALYMAERFAATGQKDAAATIYIALSGNDSFPAPLRGNALRSKILLDEEKYESVFIEILGNDDWWKVTLDLANQLKSPKTGKLILARFGTLSHEKKAVLLEVLGARKDAAVVPELIAFAQENEPLTKTAAVKALGRIGDLRAVDAILNAVSSPDPALADAGKTSLSQLQGPEFNAVIIKILHSPEKPLRLAALHVIGERHIADGAANVRQLFGDNDAEIRTAAYEAFAQSVMANGTDLEKLLRYYQDAAKQNLSEAEQLTLRETVKTVCRKMSAPEEGVAVIETLRSTGDVPTQLFCLDLLFSLGGEKAGQSVARAALSTEDAVVDRATEILGNWTTADIAPALIDLAAKHPKEKYRIRTLRGYIRIIRQIGLPPEQKAEMIQKAEVLARREEDKTLIAETKERIQNQLRGKPVFDGKTFDGWEFRNEENAKWFRIEDGAIVGGTLKERIPRNEFVCTVKEYGDFTLRLEVKVTGDGANAGVQFRSKRLTDDPKKPNEMSGYQADMTNTPQFWGSLYDESRRNRFLAEADQELVKSLFRPNSWNDLEIVCKGNNIKIFLNGRQTVDYTEPDTDIPQRGVIGLQIHAAPASEVRYRNIRMEED
ncbi:MAG: DUF1080 domain-containing protein [Planctomycetaceae bacterium]|jgi:HEAT repeat protein|nr:DUF1080 domain-containing protein [Planctomycetaceae bacterium]